jgi:hypothetical protein
VEMDAHLIVKLSLDMSVLEAHRHKEIHVQIFVEMDSSLLELHQITVMTATK